MVNMGAAGVCPNNDCTGIRLVQGPGNTGSFQQWVPGSFQTSPGGQNGADFTMAMIQGHWEITGPGPVQYEQWTFSYNPVGFGLAGFSLTFTHDQRGRFHVTPAVNIGKGIPLLGFGFSWTEGWMNDQNQNLRDFLGGWGCSYGAQAGPLGETHEFSSGGKGTSTTFLATPQVGIGCGYTTR